MMGRGDKQIDVSTLRRLLPLWMASAGFDVLFKFGDNASVPDSMLVSSKMDRVRRYLTVLLRRVTITDGAVAYRECEIEGTVLIRVWGGE